jgi:sialate O-acetylesterase
MNKHLRMFLWSGWLLALLFVQKSPGEVKLSKLISDGMVLQRNTPLKIWGWAAAGEKIKIDFNGKSFSATTGENGKWFVNLPKQKAGGPFEMQIEGDNKVVIKNILVGDVWICSGQSNMTITMTRVKDLYPEEIKNCENNFIRQFLVPQKYDFNTPREDVAGGKWESAGSNTILNFAAVGYFFALKLYEKYHVPIGLINAAIGGTPVESWMSEEVVKNFPNLYQNLVKHKDDNYLDGIRNAEKKLYDDWYAKLLKDDLGNSIVDKKWSDTTYNASTWPTMNIPCFWDEGGLGRTNGVAWFRKEIDVPKSMTGVPARLELGTIVDSDSAFVNGKFVGNITYQYPPRKYDFASGILKEGKNIIVVRVVNNAGRGGFIKGKPYQLIAGNETIDLKGEWKYKLGAAAKPLPPQTFFYYAPAGLYNGMISPLLNCSIKGAIWYQGESNTGRAKEYQKLFPALINNWREKWNQGNFPFIYAQLPNFMAAKDQPSESQWAELRDAQFKTLSLPNTGMAISIDLGEWNDIHPLRKKDVGERLALCAEKIAYGNKKIVSSGPLFKSMKIEKNKIILSFANAGRGLISKDGKELKYFAIAGADNKFVWAKAEIKNSKVITWNEEIENPVAVRYAWADNPEGVNFYNKEGLPASPFRTDEQK